MRKERSGRLLRTLSDDPDYASNSDFNTALDARGTRYLAGFRYHPSILLYRTDPDAYRVRLQQWEARQRRGLETRVRRILSHDGQNEARFNQLSRQVEGGHVVPFVGAGLSIPCGKKSWNDFLLATARRAEMDENAVSERLRGGDHERVTDEIVAILRDEVFNEQVENEYGEPSALRGAIVHLPGLHPPQIVTTNFDSLVEDSITSAGMPPFTTAMGVQSRTLLQAFARGERVLLKLHGDARDLASRILTRGEYDGAYGKTLDFKKPLPNALDVVYSSRSFLFLGCSLNQDRTMQCFRRIRQRRKELQIPKHYAILEAPVDTRARLEREQFLAERNIFPIWYPRGEHDSVEDLLRLLALRRAEAEE
jgi:hypothetical protein